MKKFFTNFILVMLVLIVSANITFAQTAILEEDFEGGSLPADWTVIDNDQDGNGWTNLTPSHINWLTPHSGTNVVGSFSWNNGTLTPDNYLITPLVAGATSVKYYFTVSETYPTEHYAVMASTTGKAIGDFTIIFEETATSASDWTERIVDLPAGTKYVAFRHYNSTNQHCILLDDITIFGIVPTCPSISNLSATVNDNDVSLTWDAPSTSESYTYTITKDGVEIETSYEATTYTDLDLEADTYEYCVKVVCESCTSESVCESATVIVEEDNACPPVSDLTASVNGNNTVTLSWVNPSVDALPSGCTGDFYFVFFRGNNYLGINKTEDLTTWTTDVLQNGTHTLSVVAFYLNDNGDFICSAEACATVTISGSFDCPPITDLSVAMINEDNAVVINWTNPPENEWPSEYMYYYFYDGETFIGEAPVSGLTSWSTPMLTQGIHSIGVIIIYSGVCVSDIVFEEVTITNSYTCPPVTNLNAEVNPDNTVTLTWTNSEQPSTCDGFFRFEFYLGAVWIDESDTEDLTTWTTGVLPNGTHTLSVVVYYLNGNYNFICSAEASTTVTIDDSFDCPPVTNLTAEVNAHKTVTFSWTNPVSSAWPNGCTGNLDFEFFDGDNFWDNDDTDDLTSWTSSEALSNGTHTLSVVIYYYDDAGNNICFAEASTTVTIGEITCPSVSNLVAEVNDNDVSLTWDAPSTSDSYTYTITKDGVDLETGYATTTYTDLDLAAGTYNYCVKVVYESCISESVCESAIIEEEVPCPSVSNLVAEVNDNDVNLTWDAPSTSDSYTYTITKDGVEIETSYEATTYTDLGLVAGTYNYCVKVVYESCTSESVCESATIIVEEDNTCPPVIDLTATINADNTVTLNWTNPAPSTWPSTCEGDLFFDFHIGDYVGEDDTDDLTTWTSSVLANGTHTLRVIVSYYDSDTYYICEAEANIVVTISGSFDCPPVINLTASANPDNTVTLNWTNPEPSAYPDNCDGEFGFEFYLGATFLWYDDTENLNSWTSDEIPNGNHTLSVVVYYYDNFNNLICSAIASATVTISGGFDCPSVANLNATINEDNTVTLTWTNPQPADFPIGCSGNLDFQFYDGAYHLGDDETNDLTSWTTPSLSPSTHTLAVVVEYYDDGGSYICSAEENITVITTNIEDIRSSLFSAEIYPNPAKDMLNIVSDSEIISYELYDAIGRLMLNNSNVSNTESIVNVSSLKHGMYMLRLNTVNGSGTFKLIIDN